MPIFNQQLRKVDYDRPQEALKAMAQHIKYIQEQLEYTLMNLGSSNGTEIETDKTTITSGSGGVSFTGTSISLKGKNGEVFEAGLNSSGIYQFRLSGRNGQQIFYLTSAGELVITENATISIDGGEWT